MAIPKRALLLSSCALTFFSARYAPKLLVKNGSYVWSIAMLFLLQYFAQVFWKVLIYPFFLSPLRHLPQPPVGLCVSCLDVKLRFRDFCVDSN
jgi:hypothetical protein